MRDFTLAGSGDVELLDGVGNIIAVGRTLTDAGLQATVQKQDIRGGAGAAIQATFYHSTNFSANITDITFKPEWLALNIGSKIELGGNARYSEQLEIKTANTITVTKTPVNVSHFGTIGYYTVVGIEMKPKMLKFVGNNASVENLPVGATVCVNYFIHDRLSEVVDLYSAFKPAEVFLRITFPGYKVSASQNGGEIFGNTSSAEVMVEIPRFKLTGNFNIGSNMTSNSPVSINGDALSYIETQSCSSEPKYAKCTITNKENRIWDNMEAIATSKKKYTDGEPIQSVVVNDKGNVPLNPSELTYVVVGQGNSINQDTGEVVVATNGSVTISLTPTPDMPKWATEIKVQALLVATGTGINRHRKVEVNGEKGGN